MDWRRVTIEGFKAGVTRAELEGRLGPAQCSESSEPKDPVLTLMWSKYHWFRFETYRNGRNSLVGQRIEYDGRVLTNNFVGGGYIGIENPDPHPEDPPYGVCTAVTSLGFWGQAS